MHKIAKRLIIVIPAVLLQLAWLYILGVWFSHWAVPVGMILTVLSFVLVIFIMTKRDEGAYKMLWLLVILLFPLPGTILYLVFGNKRTTRPLRKKLEAAPALPPLPEAAASVGVSLAADNLRVAQTFRYVERLTGSSVAYAESARYFSLGDTMFPAMLEAVEQAQEFIFAEYFIVERGVMWDTLVEALERKVAQGVDVRIMYDDLGSISTYDIHGVWELKEKGIRCIPFNPLLFVRGTLNYRDHRKMLVVDGTVAFSGGINLADEYINHVERFGHWKDIGFELTGAPAQAYTRMFAEFWNAFANDPIPERFLAPVSAVHTVANGYVLSYYDSPLRPHAVSNELYIDLLSQATRYAWFFTPYLLPGEALLDALVRAAERGVDVRIIMPGVPDKKIVFRMAHGFYPTLLAAGVKIYEYTPGFVHAKGCVVDDVLGTVGTVNLDYRSLFLHFENNSLFYRSSLLADLKADFEATQAQCREMVLGHNVRESFGGWLVNGVLRLFAPLC